MVITTTLQESELFGKCEVFNHLQYWILQETPPPPSLRNRLQKAIVCQVNYCARCTPYFSREC